MRYTGVPMAQTVTVAIRGVVVDRLTFPAVDRAEEYKANVRRWSREQLVPVTVWTQTGAGAGTADAARRGAIALAV